MRILRFFRFHARFGVRRAGCCRAERMHGPRQRPDGAVARADRRRASEAARDGRPVADGCGHGSSTESCALSSPRSRRRGTDRLRALVAAEAAGEHSGRPAATPGGSAAPRSRQLPMLSGSRLRLSNKARKRLDLRRRAGLGEIARALAYRVGPDALSTACSSPGEPAEARPDCRVAPPRLPISGGLLIKRGLAEGPIVARTLKLIEDRWVEAGFPRGRVRGNRRRSARIRSLGQYPRHCDRQQQHDDEKGGAKQRHPRRPGSIA